MLGWQKWTCRGQGSVAGVVRTTLLEDLSTSLEPAEMGTSELGQDVRGQAAQNSQQSPTAVDQLSFTVLLEDHLVSTQISGAPPVVTRVHTCHVGKSGTLREWAQPLAAVRAVPVGT